MTLVAALAPWLLLGLIGVVAALVYCARRPLDLLDPVSYFLLAHLVFLYLGIFYAGRYAAAVALSGEVVLLVILGVVCFALGVLGADLLLSAERPPRRMAVASLDRGYVVAAWLILCLGALFLAAYGVRAGLVDWFGGGGFDDYRVEVRMGEGKFALLAIAFVTTGAWLTSVDLLFRQRRWLASWLVAGASAALLLLVGNRAPSADLLVVQLFLWCVFVWGRLPAAVAGGAVVTLLLAIALLGAVRQEGTANLDLVLSKALWRPFVNLQNLQLVVAAYPEQIAFERGGTMLRDLSVVLPGYQPNYGTWLKEALGLRFSGGGLTVTHLGEAFANFGWRGVVLVPLALGGALAVLGRVTRRWRRHAATLPLLAAIAVTAKAMVSSGIVTPVLYVLAPLAVAFVAHLLLAVGIRVGSARLGLADARTDR